MKQTLIVLALLGVTSARHHHHNYQSFAQESATPASNRADFEAARNAASNTVATQRSFESTKTADVAARNAANTKATFDLRSKVRLARHHQIENEVHHDQWVTRANHSNWAQTSTPDQSRSAFENGVASASDVVAKQQAFEKSQTDDIEARHDKQAADTFKKNAASRDARVDQTRGGAKNSRDSKGWRVVWPAGSLSQEETPEESYNAKSKNSQAVEATVKAQQQYEARSVAENAAAQDKSADNTAAQKLKIRNLQDDVTRGGAQPARDSLGWSVAQQPANKWDHVNSMGNKGQIQGVHDFLTADGSDDMRDFVASRDTIGTAGYDEKVRAFVRPNIVYGTNDKGFDPSVDSLAQTGSKFLGNPERVNVLDPIAYQTRANSNTLDDMQIRRTSFYAQHENKI